MKVIAFDSLEKRSYFFDQGLRFTCTKCGACCVGEPGTIYVTGAEIEIIAASLNRSVDAFTAQYLYPYKDSYSIKEDEQGRCLFFDEGCAIYAIRPLQCRTFPFWFSNLRSQHRWQQIKCECPGIGRGRLYSREEIIKLAQESMPI
ncbi:MAG: YkgJ family cysteine cluster protein [Desulfobacteraceae bacterium]|jgi:Fe-S-cluster containining protein